MENYEQKYKEALERAKSIRQGNCEESFLYNQGLFEYLFPELKESEDERIRKFISNELACLRASDEKGSDRYEELTNAIAWIEKQCERKQHLELKAGHWYICHSAYCCRADHLTVKEGERFMCEKDGVVKGFVIKEPEKYFKEVCAPAPFEDEQKPAWSEEDSPYYDDICEILINLLHSETADVNKDVVQKDLYWLISIKDRIQPQPKQEWSEEDEERYVSCLQRLGTGNPEQPETINSKWFKEHVYPQSTWKPSDEQMKFLWKYAEQNNYDGTILTSLFHDLKKLKGE